MTRTVVESFTLTQAKLLASKVAADMRRCQQIYGEPSDKQINDFGTELAILLRDNYVQTFEFGYVRTTDEERVLTWKYAVDASGTLTSNDRPGRIISGVNLSGATFRTYLVTSAAWSALSTQQKEAIAANLPVKRSAGPGYKSSLGVWQKDLCYSASGVAMLRESFKPHGY